ncbi:Glyoxylate/hydroxypyruvate reductase HPR3 [Hibiscus syriacus]|uniref:Glyoxylate/hydroxypyruvate reductase HPR3 n=1 Tax=Hibiscus syriacus TaxID=106335 RepID=A0A6A2XNX4_HIBSY|nr:Glyoxylate/hydroxypyruvate reductase HPR3 [Hibiscus syriacus]
MASDAQRVGTCMATFGGCMDCMATYLDRWAYMATYMGTRIGIVGLGRIGSEVAKRLLAFGCSVAYCSRKVKPYVPFAYCSTVNDLAKNSDALILRCSLTEETHHMIDNGVMEALGKEGVIINIGRGALIDEKELMKFLLFGARENRWSGLDVYEGEPFVPQELFAMENVVLAPHASVFTPDSSVALQELVIGNLREFFSNEPLLSLTQLE